MKKLIALVLALTMALTLCACGGDAEAAPAGNAAQNDAENVAPEKPAEKPAEEPKEFPFVGTWANEDGTVYLRIQDGGIVLAESVMTNSSTSTINGVTTSSVSKTLITSTYSWKEENGKFLFNGMAIYTPETKNGEYSLVGEKITYYRVGDLSYEIQLDAEESGKKDIQKDAKKYTLGSKITAPGIELTLKESGIASDIRISSESTGIKITSGPSAEPGKQYVYLRGTLKNTGKTAARAVIGGTVFMDDYEFALKTDTISTSGTPKSSIDPMETVHILLYAQVSDEVAAIFAEGKIVFAFNDNFANVQVDQAEHLYYVEVTR